MDRPINRIHMILKSAAKRACRKEADQVEYYSYYAYEYISDRVETLLSQAGNLDAATEICRRIELALDGIGSTYKSSFLYDDDGDDW